jgi:hypothetical protein
MEFFYFKDSLMGMKFIYFILAREFRLLAEQEVAHVSLYFYLQSSNEEGSSSKTPYTFKIYSLLL